MAQKYKAVLTNVGAAKIAAATAGGTKINLTQMAVGDGGGTLPTPDPAQTQLIAEKHRAALNKVIIDPKHKNYLVAERVIPPEIGGFWMRELGLFDEVGDLIAVSNMAESYKPLLSEGSGRAQTLRMVVIVSDMDTVNVLIDSSTVLATQEYVDDKWLEHEQSRRHPDATLKEKGFTQLSSATNSDSEALAATPKAIKTAYDKASEADNHAKTADDNAGKANENANGRLAKDQNGADIPNKPKFIENIGLNETVNKAANALPVINRVLSVDLNTLGRYEHTGVYRQDADVNATADKHYPIQLSGTLLVTLSAYGCQQEYTTYSTSRKFMRSLLGVWNGSGPWSPWVEAYSESHKPTPSEISAVPSAGGHVGYLDQADYYATKPNVPPRGSGGWAAQLNSGAPFYAPNWAWPVAQGGCYVPLVKGVSSRAGVGYPCAVSFGYLLPGDNTWASPFIHAKGDNSECSWQFNINTGEIWSSKVGSMSTQADAQNRANDAYNRATLWAYQNMVSDIRMGANSYVDWGSGGGTVPAGCVLTGGNFDDDKSRAFYAPIQKRVNGNWYNVAGV